MFRTLWVTALIMALIIPVAPVSAQQVAQQSPVAPMAVPDPSVVKPANPIRSDFLGQWQGDAEWDSHYYLTISSIDGEKVLGTMQIIPSIITNAPEEFEGKLVGNELTFTTVTTRRGARLELVDRELRGEGWNAKSARAFRIILRKL